MRTAHASNSDDRHAPLPALLTLVGQRAAAIGPRKEVPRQRYAAGSILYHGGHSLRQDSRVMFLTPHREYAATYVGADGTSVHTYRTRVELTFIPKEDAAWVASRGRKPRGEWYGLN